MSSENSDKEETSTSPRRILEIRDVRDHKKEDRMESFFLSETTKYLYLLFDPDNFIHNQGIHGKIVDTAIGECIIETGGYIFNTEAHPIDPGALNCCSTVAYDGSYGMDIESKIPTFIKGKSVKEKIKNTEINNQIDTNDTQEDHTKLFLESLKPVNSYISDTTEIKIIVTTDYDQNETQVSLESSLPVVENNKTQQILDKVNYENKYSQNITITKKFKIFQCNAQPFLQRLSIFGEFFSNTYLGNGF